MNKYIYDMYINDISCVFFLHTPHLARRTSATQTTDVRPQSRRQFLKPLGSGGLSNGNQTWER